MLRKLVSTYGLLIFNCKRNFQARGTSDSPLLTWPALLAFPFEGHMLKLQFIQVPFSNVSSTTYPMGDSNLI